MKYPNFNEERKLRKKGYELVVGIDESGRGSLVGPVVAAAVIINSNLKTPAKSQARQRRQNSKLQLKTQNLNLFKNIKDSKKLTPRRREEIYKIIKKSSMVEWGIGKVSEKVIDRINILEATKLAMEKAVKNLIKKIVKNFLKIKNIPCHNFRGRGNYGMGGFLIIDGNFSINSTLPQKSIIRGDEKIVSCALASIVAKVTRDRIMLNYHKKYPQYGFDKHKGYPTSFHFGMLEKYNSSVIHRLSFTLFKK